MASKLDTGMLVSLGLTKSEIKVYLTLLELNFASATQIAELSGLYRKNVYDALDRLLKKGLISYRKDETKRIFNASDPQGLLEFVEMKKKEIQAILPELRSIYKSTPTADEMTTFKGKEGIKTILTDVLKTGMNYDKIGPEERFREVIPYFYMQYQRRKAEIGIRCRAIYDEKERNSASVKDYIGRKRFLPLAAANTTTTIIYGSRAAIIIWKDIPIGIQINSKEIAGCYRTYFQLLWNIART